MPSFDPAGFLAGSFGIFQGDDPLQTIRIRFSAAVSRVVAERQQHPTQRLTPQADGSLLAEFELSSLEELSSWVLSFGPQAEVLSPARFRDQIAGALAASLANYRAGPTTAGRGLAAQGNGKPRKLGRQARPK